MADELPERDATPDEAFELGRVAGHDELFAELQALKAENERMRTAHGYLTLENALDLMDLTGDQEVVVNAARRVARSLPGDVVALGDLIDAVALFEMKNPGPIEPRRLYPG